MFKGWINRKQVLEKTGVEFRDEYILWNQSLPFLSHINISSSFRTLEYNVMTSSAIVGILCSIMRTFYHRKKFNDYL